MHQKSFVTGTRQALNFFQIPPRYRALFH